MKIFIEGFKVVRNSHLTEVVGAAVVILLFPKGGPILQSLGIIFWLVILLLCKGFCVHRDYLEKLRELAPESFDALRDGTYYTNFIITLYAIHSATTLPFSLWSLLPMSLFCVIYLMTRKVLTDINNILQTSG
jgi:hypothetical protein